MDGVSAWEDDPKVVAAVEKASGGFFEDDEFVVQIKSKRGKLESVPELLYNPKGAPPAGGKHKKVDGWSRLSQMGTPGEKLSDGSLLVLRDAINDGWLLSAIGMVQTRPELLSRIHHVPEHTSGLHALRIFKNGVWETVVVDDMVPCIGRLKPAYGSNTDPTAGKVALLEKALAKLYGSYEHLHSGRVGAALEDLTGGISDKIYLRDGAETPTGTPKQPQLDAANEIESGAMYARLEALLQEGQLLGASYKSKYAHLGKAGESAAMGGGAGPDATVVFPIVDMRRAQVRPRSGLVRQWRREGSGWVEVVTGSGQFPGRVLLLCSGRGACGSARGRAATATCDAYDAHVLTRASLATPAAHPPRTHRTVRTHAPHRTFTVPLRRAPASSGCAACGRSWARCGPSGRALGAHRRSSGRTSRRWGRSWAASRWTARFG